MIDTLKWSNPFVEVLGFNAMDVVPFLAIGVEDSSVEDMRLIWDYVQSTVEDRGVLVHTLTSGEVVLEPIDKSALVSYDTALDYKDVIEAYIR